MAELCTLDEVLTHPAFRKLRAATVDEYDREFVAMAIRAVSNRFEKKTGRKFQKNTYTEYFSPCSGQSSVQLTAYPVESITSFVESSQGDWTEGSIDSSSYGLDANSGILKIRYYNFVEGFNTVRVVYLGGYDPIPDDLKFACMLQVAHEVELAPKTATSSQQASAGGQASYAPLEFLPAVQSILADYTIARV